MSIKFGAYGDAPRTAKRDYLTVLMQLLWRMRYDILIMTSLCTLVISGMIPIQIPSHPQHGSGVISITGITVSIFIGFRNKQAIGRWWEARQLWGVIRNQSLNWSDTLTSLLPEDELKNHRGRNLIRYQVAMAWQLNFQLRNFYHHELRDFQDYLLKSLEMKPTTTLRDLGIARAIAVRKLFEDGLINHRGREILMSIANSTINGIGGLERIRNTPLPASYDVFVRLITWIYGMELLITFHTEPTTLVGRITGIILFVGFLMAERIGAYVEGPFDADGSSFSLPINTICLLISRELLGNETDSCLHHFSKDPVRWT